MYKQILFQQKLSYPVIQQVQRLTDSNIRFLA